MTIGEAKKDVRRPKQAMVTKQNEGKPTILDGTRRQPSDILSLDAAIWRGDCESFLAGIPEEPLFDLVVTSPPYNIGKSYEKKDDLAKYLEWQERVIDLLIPRLRDTGSLCWQVGNFVDNGQIAPLDIEFAPISGSTSARAATRCSSPSRATAACSVPTARCLVRRSRFPASRAADSGRAEHVRNPIAMHCGVQTTARKPA